MEITLQKNETRKNYLIRVAIAFLNDNSHACDTIIFDEAECDGFCLADDLEFKFVPDHLTN